jgi:hypothetical protein
MAFPLVTVIKADFVGEAHFDSSNQATKYLTQSSIVTMVMNAFKGTNFWELLLRFSKDDILGDIGDVQSGLPLTSRKMLKLLMSLDHPVPHRILPLIFHH